MIKIKIGNFHISNNLPLFIIAGPCVIENENHSLLMAEKIKKIEKKGKNGHFSREK